MTGDVGAAGSGRRMVGASALASFLTVTGDGSSRRLGSSFDESDLMVDLAGFSESLVRSNTGSSGSSVTANTWKSLVLTPEFHEENKERSTLVSGIKAMPTWGCCEFI